MKSRNELRDIIIKVLYQESILKAAKEKFDINTLIKDQLEVENEFVNTSVNDILKYEQDIISIANKYLKNWTIDRLSKVDQAILKLAIYELKYTDIPSIVAINEAIELSKKYSDEAVSKMINGVLDNIYHSEENHE